MLGLTGQEGGSSGVALSSGVLPRESLSLILLHGTLMIYGMATSSGDHRAESNIKLEFDPFLRKNTNEDQWIF